MIHISEAMEKKIKLKTIVEIKGGAVTDIWSTVEAHEVEILDWDDAATDDDAKEQAEETARNIEEDGKAGKLFPVW